MGCAVIVLYYVVGVLAVVNWLGLFVESRQLCGLFATLGLVFVV